MMLHVFVWLRRPAGDRELAGEILVGEPDSQRGGRVRGEFRYRANYLENPRALALDPLHLPLQAHPTPADDPATGLHGVFEDSLPDAWGRAILCRRYELPRLRQRPAHLLERVGAEGLGALAYTPTAQWQEGAEVAQLPALASLVEAAERYETDPNAPIGELLQLFRAGSSPGGARPKVLVRDGQTQYLAKFPSSRDRFDMVRVEAATLACAREAGITVPDFSVVDLGSRSALLLNRFDVTPAGGRNHMISMKTLLGAQNYYFLGYGDMADVVRRVSDRPGRDLQALFRQSVFNALIGNTDDHLKNFAMLHGEDGWHLTPAYDLLPDVGDNREHVLHFGAVGTRPTTEALRQLGRAFGLSSQRTRALMDDLVDAVAGFAGQCDLFGVPPSQTESLTNRLPLTHLMSA